MWNNDKIGSFNLYLQNDIIIYNNIQLIQISCPDDTSVSIQQRFTVPLLAPTKVNASFVSSGDL